MAEINIKRFVDIDIEQHVHSTVSGTRGTVVLYTSEGTKGTTNLIESLGDAAGHYASMATTMAYLEMFFNNGGVSVLVVEGMPASAVTNDVISALDNKYIVICAANPASNTTATYNALKAVATARAADTNIYGINEKIILARTTSGAKETWVIKSSASGELVTTQIAFTSNGQKFASIGTNRDLGPITLYYGNTEIAGYEPGTETRYTFNDESYRKLTFDTTPTGALLTWLQSNAVKQAGDTIDKDAVANFGVKYSTVLGAEMTIAAYLSRVNVYRTNTVADYMFTQEALTDEKVDDTTFGSILDENMNVDVYLAGAVRNMGGNLKNGADLINSYVKIILHQTLTERLLDLLTTKIKGARGLAQIYATVAQELEAYRSCGYLTTDKVWTDEDLTTTYNGQTYTIITKGTPLLLGYSIKILPLSSLTLVDKTERKTPPIYIIIADQYGIRKITINGEVI